MTPQDLDPFWILGASRGKVWSRCVTCFFFGFVVFFFKIARGFRPSQLIYRKHRGLFDGFLDFDAWMFDEKSAWIFES